MTRAVALALALLSSAAAGAQPRIVSAGSAASPTTAASDAPRILVMPFDNTPRDARTVWLGEASAVLLADGLNALGAAAVTRDERLQAFERLQVPRAATLTDATVIRIGQLIGAAQVVVGSLQLQGDTLTVHARTITLETGRVDADATESGPMPELFAIYERVARRLEPRAPGQLDAGPSKRTSLPAFEQYIKGLLAETPATAINYLNAALQLQPDFDRARLALWAVETDRGNHAQALQTLAPVAATSPWFRRARFCAGLSELSLDKNDDAFATFKALSDAAANAPVLNNLGVVQLRRGSTPQTGQATYYFNRAAELDPTDSDYFFNLGYAYWVQRDTQAVIYWLREAVRRNAADGEAHFILGAALSGAGHTAEASREKELAKRLSSVFEQWDRRPLADAVPKGLERVKSDVELPHGRRLDQTITSTEQRDQQQLARFYVDRGRRLFDRENDREALTELNRALYLSPYDPAAHLLVGRIHLRNGRVREAIDAFKISLWSHETAEAHVALGDAYLQAKDGAAARAEAERALALDPSSADARRLLERAGPKQ
jgi:tetratricopeptide (TPR) repeat protein